MTDDTAPDDGAGYAVTVQKYGLLPPRDWDAACEDELRGMTALWNRLVEIETVHRAAVLALTAADAAVAAADGDYEAVLERLRAVRENRAGQRKAARKKVKTPELDAEIEELTARLRDAGTIRKEARRAARADAKPQLDALNKERKEAVKMARQQSGLYWGNYNAVVASYERGRMLAAKRGGALKFRRHCDRPENGLSSARIVNQIQGGTTAARLMAGECSQVRLAGLQPATWKWRPDVPRSSIRGGRNGNRQNGILYATIFRHDNVRRQVAWPIIYDQPIPEDAIIQEVIVTRRSVAGAFEWSVSFLLRMPALAAPARDDTACGIDLGWRRLNDGIRVATIVTGDGPDDRQFIVLPEIFIRRQNRVAELDSMRALAADKARAPLRALTWPDAPEALRPLAMKALRTKRCEHLHDLAVAWRVHPEWEPEAAAALHLWRAQDRKDWQEHDGLARRIGNARRDIYRCAVKPLAERYGVIGIEDVDWAAIGRRIDNDGADNDIATATAAYRRLAAPGMFLLELRRAAAAAGARVHVHRGKSTWICQACGTEQAPADPAALIHTCPHCHAAWDQDVNAARNLRAAAMASAPVPPDDPAALADGNAGNDEAMDDAA